MTALLDRARAWLADDPDPRTRTELQGLVDAVEAGGDPGELADLFDGDLVLGTAGLRGPLGAGPRRMNRMVVSRTAAGLAAYLRSRETAADGVVIGYDARRNSEVFALDTAAVLQGAGVPAMVLPRPLPTPVLAHTVRELGSAAGVMVTASHNPAPDNGCKIYLGDGCQIAPPEEAMVAAAIAAAGPAADLPRSEAWTRLEESWVATYVDAVGALLEPGGPRALTIVYTPLHGVGGELVGRALAAAGFAAPHVVPEQAEPDPAFPTLAFPNPEERGALDLAVTLAQEIDADLVLANDPDADRAAVAVPTGGGWRALHGDEVGALLADDALRRGVRGVYATTVASSSLLRAMVRAHGQEYAETLTGFKWIGRVPGLVFGYEEALGFCLAPELLPDKDGISAVVRLAEIAARHKAGGRTLVDVLDDLAMAHGLHATDQLSLRVTDAALVGEAMARLRSQPPTALGGLAVEGVDDLTQGDADLPATDALRLRLADGARVVVRPSGTEAKLKGYLEVVVPVDPEDGVDAARITAAGRLDAIGVDLAHAAGLPMG